MPYNIVCTVSVTFTNTPFGLAGSFRVLPFFILFFISFGGIAQKIGYGPKVGINSSVFRGDMGVKGMRGVHLGFTVGGFMSVKFQSNKKWQVEINLLYTTRGNNSSFFNIIDNDPNNDDYRTEFKYNLSYIEVPILFKYMLNKGGTTRPYLFFGPTYGGLIGANFSEKRRDINVFESVKRDDFGLTVGWGITSFFIDRWYHLDLRYFHGFVDVSDNLAKDLYPFSRGGGIQEINSYYNSTVSLTLAVSLEKSSTFFLR